MQLSMFYVHAYTVTKWSVQSMSRVQSAVQDSAIIQQQKNACIVLGFLRWEIFLQKEALFLCNRSAHLPKPTSHDLFWFCIADFSW